MKIKKLISIFGTAFLQLHFDICRPFGSFFLISHPQIDYNMTTYTAYDLTPFAYFYIINCGL